MKDGIADPRRARFWVVRLAIGAIVAGSLLDIATRADRWPFSHYPMFAGLCPPRKSERFLYGVVDGPGGAEEIRLSGQSYVRPLGGSRLSAALRWKEGERLQAALANLLALYEANRRAGVHQGPRIVGLRVYSCEWNLSPDAPPEDRGPLRKLEGEARLGEPAAKDGRP